MEKIREYGALLLMFIFLSGCTAEKDPPSRIDHRDLDGRIQVIGALGLPLGTVVTIEGSIVAGRDLGSKALASAYLIRADRVDGTELAEQPVLRFRIRGAGLSLAEDSSTLRLMKTGEDRGPCTDEQIRELEKGYVGSRVRVLGYETGSFNGIPADVPLDLSVWQDHGFGFGTRLILLRNVDDLGENGPEETASTSPVLLTRPEIDWEAFSTSLEPSHRVIITAEISTEGKVENAIYTERSGNEKLDAAVMQALLESVYKPATKSGKPVAVTLTIVAGPDAFH